ncbi:MAG: hypothetical protein Q9187_003207 [Circinaria calcarea]
MPFAQASAELGNLFHDSPRPQFIRRANVSTITEETTTTRASLTTTITALTIVTPSPSASAIAITSQSQLVTSYIPQLTACPIVTYGSPLAKRQIPHISGPIYSYSNSSRSTTKPSPSCSVLYSPTVTPICHTTLTPLGGIPTTITACDQNIAFKTDYGHYYPSNGTVGLVPTTYVAPWDGVITGVPTGAVLAYVCPSGEACTEYAETWYTEVFQATETSMTARTPHPALPNPNPLLRHSNHDLHLDDFPRRNNFSLNNYNPRYLSRVSDFDDGTGRGKRGDRIRIDHDDPSDEHEYEVCNLGGRDGVCGDNRGCEYGVMKENERMERRGRNAEFGATDVDGLTNGWRGGYWASGLGLV